MRAWKIVSDEFVSLWAKNHHGTPLTFMPGTSVKDIDGIGIHVHSDRDVVIRWHEEHERWRHRAHHANAPVASRVVEVEYKKIDVMPGDTRPADALRVRACRVIADVTP